MSIVIIAALLTEKEKYGNEKIKRKILRDHSNPMEMPEMAFIEQFRVNKSAFEMIMEEIKPFCTSTSIPLPLQLAATLRFLAEGSYQRAVGKDANVDLGRSTVSKVISATLTAMERHICPKWINLKMNDNERHNIKREFFDNFGIPGIVGCIDGTHIRLVKPKDDGFAYYNRKGFYSINAMIICDFNMEIRAIDACHPGSSHDAFIWNLSRARDVFITRYQRGDRNLWLLGDAGYGIEPFLLTPYRDPEHRSVQHRFNMAHASARNVVERTIGFLKARFRCLLKTLQYNPIKAVQIINVCCTLHNICRSYMHNIDYALNDEVVYEDSESENIVYSVSNGLQSEGRIIRDGIALHF